MSRPTIPTVEPGTRGSGGVSSTGETRHRHDHRTRISRRRRCDPPTVSGATFTSRSSVDSLRKSRRKHPNPLLPRRKSPQTSTGRLQTFRRRPTDLECESETPGAVKQQKRERNEKRSERVSNSETVPSTYPSDIERKVRAYEVFSRRIYNKRRTWRWGWYRRGPKSGRVE